MGLLIKEDSIIGRLKKIKTKERLQRKVSRLINIAMNLAEEECQSCESYKEGCKNKNIEAIEMILGVIKKDYMPEFQFSYEKVNKIQPEAKLTIFYGDSMFPTANIGDIAIIRDFIDLKLGDIILFFCYDKFVFHKIIGFENKPNMVITQGVNNGGFVERIKRENVIGVVSAIVKKEENKELYDFLYKSICDRNDKIGGVEDVSI